MKNNQIYFALTIGPIVDTINSARTTREMWASSYLFSYIIRNLVTSFRKKGMNILLPSAGFLHDKSYCGAGIYPDRIIGVSSLKQSDVEESIQDIIRELSEKILSHFDRKDQITHSFGAETIKKYLDNYLRICYFQRELDVEENIIGTLYPYLDAMELQPRLLPPEDYQTILVKLVKDYPSKATINSSPLRLFTDLVNKSFLIDDGFDKILREEKGLPVKENFSSINEISTVQLKEINYSKYKEFEEAIRAELNECWQEVIHNKEDLDKEEVLDILKRNFKKEYRTYHNYIAIVTGDGDHVGNIIRNLGNAKIAGKDETTQVEALQEFSQLLTRFSIEASKIIDDFGATPIFIGGDDLFFFAPVVGKSQNRELNTIFDLVKSLDELFNQIINNQNKIDFGLTDENKPTLSFGISITYHKFPLNETKKISNDLLFDIAKKKMNRNSIGVTILKNSGHDISFGIKKDKTLFDTFLKLVKSNIGSDDKFINSITYKLHTLKQVISPIASNKDRVENFLKNNFNENYESNLLFYESMRDYIVEISQIDNSLSESGFNLLYGTLRFIHFIRSNEKE